MFRLPTRLQGHAGPGNASLKRKSVREHALYVRNVGDSLLPRESKAIKIEANDSVEIPLAPPSQCLVEEITLDQR